MSKHSDLVPARFLVLIAHFSICVCSLWNEESLKSCSMGSRIASNPTNHLIELKIGLSVTVGLICLEFLTFICGFTMFNPTSALLSICGHALTCLTTTLFVIDGWQCGWFWWIFAFGSVIPVLYDAHLVIVSLIRKTW